MPGPPYVKVGVSLRDRAKELNDTELRVLLALGLRIDQERQCWPAVSVLVDECVKSERMIRYALAKLIKKGFINIGRRAGGRSKTSIYTLNGYFAYGTEAVQLIAPFPETLQSFAPFPGGKGAIADEKGAIADEKGAIPERNGSSPQAAKRGQSPHKGGNQEPKGGNAQADKRGQSAQAGQIRKKNHIRRTNKRRTIVQGQLPLQEGGKGDVLRVMQLLEKDRGYPSPAEAKERAAAKQMLNRGHTPEDIIACRQELKQRPFWRDKELPLNSVAGQIDNWSKIRRERGDEGGTLDFHVEDV